jgi:hypothetical protein
MVPLPDEVQKFIPTRLFPPCAPPHSAPHPFLALNRYRCHLPPPLAVPTLARLHLVPLSAIAWPLSALPVPAHLRTSPSLLTPDTASDRHPAASTWLGAAACRLTTSGLPHTSPPPPIARRHLRLSPGCLGQSPGRPRPPRTDAVAASTFFFTADGKRFVPPFNCYIRSTSQC